MRQCISALIALLIFAALFPNCILMNGKLWRGALAVTLLYTLVPFLLVFFFVGRNKVLECIGWALQVFVVGAMVFGGQ